MGLVVQVDGPQSGFSKAMDWAPGVSHNLYRVGADGVPPGAGFRAKMGSPGCCVWNLVRLLLGYGCGFGGSHATSIVQLPEAYRLLLGRGTPIPAHPIVVLCEAF